MLMETESPHNGWLSIAETAQSGAVESVDRAVEGLEILDRIVKLFNRIRRAKTAGDLPEHKALRAEFAAISSLETEPGPMWEWLDPDWDGESYVRISQLLAGNAINPCTAVEAFARWNTRMSAAHRMFEFIKACGSGQTALAAWLHSFGDIDAETGDSFAFRAACAGGHLATAQWLQALGVADLHACDNEPIRAACTGGHLGTAVWLHEQGVTTFSPLRKATLATVVARGHTDVAGWMASVGWTTVSTHSAASAAASHDAATASASHDAATASASHNAATASSSSSSSSTSTALLALAEAALGTAALPFQADATAWKVVAGMSSGNLSVADELAVWLARHSVARLEVASTGAASTGGGSSVVISMVETHATSEAIVSVPPNSDSAIQTVMLALRGSPSVEAIKLSHTVAERVQCGVVGSIRGSSVKRLALATASDMADARVSPLLAALAGSNLEELELLRMELSEDQAARLIAALPASRVRALTVVWSLLADRRAAIYRAAAASSVERLQDWDEKHYEGDDMTALVDLLQSPMLRHFDPHEAGFADDGAAFVAAVKASHLTSLSVDNLMLEEDTFVALANAIAGCPSLRKVDLPAFEGEDSAAVLEPLLSSGLRAMRLQLVCPSDTTGAEFREFLPKSQLEILELAVVADDDDVLGALVAGVCCPGSRLQELHLDGTARTAAVAVALSLALPASGLVSLRLECPALEAATATAFATAITGSKLRSLDLRGGGNRGIDSTTLAAIVAQIPESSLTALNLNGNKRISDAGAASIARVLPYSHLKDLRLSNTGMGRAGGLAIATALSGSHLCILDISQNTFPDEVSAALKAAGAFRLPRPESEDQTEAMQQRWF
jgi:hypothetical protein